MPGVFTPEGAPAAEVLGLVELTAEEPVGATGDSAVGRLGIEGAIFGGPPTGRSVEVPAPVSPGAVVAVVVLLLVAVVALVPGAAGALALVVRAVPAVPAVPVPADAPAPDPEPVPPAPVWLNAVMERPVQTLARARKVFVFMGFGTLMMRTPDAVRWLTAVIGRVLCRDRPTQKTFVPDPESA